MNSGFRFLFVVVFSLSFVGAKAQWIFESDATWKTSGTKQTGWNLPYFNDNAWGVSTSPSPNPNGGFPVVPGTKTMWLAPYNDTVFFRKTFELRSLCITATLAQIACDNEYFLYVNGILVGTGKNASVNVHNIQTNLKIGKNCIAIMAVDWGPPYQISFKATVDYTSGPIIDIGVDKYVCQGDTTFFTANHSYRSYQWSTGYTGRSAPVRKEGKYWCTATDSNGCQWIDTALLFEYKHKFVNLGNDTAICTGDEIYIDAGGYASYEWSTGDTTNLIKVNYAGHFGVTVTDGNGCKSQDKKEIIVFDQATVSLGSDTTLCKGDSVVISASFPQSKYKWSTGSEDTSIVVTKTGKYSVTISNYCGEVTDEMAVHFIESIDMKLGADDFLCYNDAYVIEPTVTGAASFLWSTGDTGSYIVVRQPVVYSVSVSDICGNEGFDEIEILQRVNQKQMIPNSFSPNRDGFNETWRTYIQSYGPFELTILDKMGKELFVSNDPKEYWDGKLNGEPLPIGNYLYKIEFTNCQNQVEITTGVVSIVR